MAYLGIDIGASKAYFVALEGSDSVAEGRYDLTPQNTGKILEVCGQIKTDLQKKGVAVEKVGVGVPGLPKDGTLNYAPNFPELVGYPLAQEVEKIFNASVVLHNDANAFTYAEVALGAALGFENVVGLTLGSGLGGGLVINGKLYVGRGGAEIGHTVLNLRGDEEAEDLASAKFFRKLGKDPVETRQGAQKGDKEAQKLWAEFGTNLGHIIANVVNILDPQAVIVGGGIGDAYELFIKEAKKSAAEHIANPESKNIPILKSSLGQAAGATGAALIAKLQTS
ncbi:ROK family protein [Candidatus Saccharibacteria bacterium]|nr:ROK family protein [Candidatus Saccharibacteria bacterium]